MIDVLLLGTGAMMPLPHRWLSSLLVRSASSLVLFDCGEGTQIPWRTYRWGFKRLDAICLTHHHADHVAGLPGLFHTVANSGKTEPMDIYGPPGTIEVIRGLRSIVPELPYAMTIHEIEGGDRFELPGGLRASVTWAEHRIPCLAYRCDLPRQPRFDRERAEALGVPRELWSKLQQGEVVQAAGREIVPEMVLHDDRTGVSFGMATDTRPTQAIVDLMQGVDLLVSEATYASDEHLPQAQQHKHMTFREAATMAKDAGAGHLWLTHFSPRVNDPAACRDNAANIFPSVDIGVSGLQGTLKFESGYQPLG